MPALDITALRKQIASRQLAPVYVFVGEDARLIERLVDAVEATVDEADRAFAIDRFHVGDKGAEPIDIASASRAYPMLRDRRLSSVSRAIAKLRSVHRKRLAPDRDLQAHDHGADVDARPRKQRPRRIRPVLTSGGQHRGQIGRQRKMRQLPAPVRHFAHSATIPR